MGLDQFKGCQITESFFDQKFNGENHSSIVAEASIKCEQKLENASLEITFGKTIDRIQAISLQLLRNDGSILDKKSDAKVFSVNI